MNTLRLAGELVQVRRSGYFWDCPYDKTHYMIGRTREEAVAALKAWKMQKRPALTVPEVALTPPAKRRAGRPTTVDGLSLDYKRALFYARSRAKQSGKAIMSMDEFVGLVKRAHCHCEVTGIKFSMERAPGHRKSMWAPSIDRIDSHKGYELENCRLVCVAVNLALNEFGADVLFKIAEALMGEGRKIKKDQQSDYDRGLACVYPPLSPAPDAKDKA